MKKSLLLKNRRKSGLSLLKTENFLFLMTFPKVYAQHMKNLKGIFFSMIYFNGGYNMSSKKQTPQERYAAKYKKQYSLPCFTSTEQDIIDRLESVPNKAGYIKALIRADIAASKDK